MFESSFRAWLSSSIIGRAHAKGILSSHVESVLESVQGNHHAADDKPFGGGPGELMRIDIIEPLIRKALAKNPELPRKNKRVLLMDPAGKSFAQADAKRLSSYDELIFVCGRYEGIDARIYHYIDESLSLGDFVLSSGDLAAMAIFDATARMKDGVLGNSDSIVDESFGAGRLEASNYTRPLDYQGYTVPDFLRSGHHAHIRAAQRAESIFRTKTCRPDLLIKHPLSTEEEEILQSTNLTNYPWQKTI